MSVALPFIFSTDVVLILIFVQPLNLPSIATAPLSHSSASASSRLVIAAAAVL